MSVQPNRYEPGLQVPLTRGRYVRKNAPRCPGSEPLPGFPRGGKQVRWRKSVDQATIQTERLNLWIDLWTDCAQKPQERMLSIQKGKKGLLENKIN